MRERKIATLCRKIIHAGKTALKPAYHFYKNQMHKRHIRKETARLRKIGTSSSCRIFYFGITEHSNLGDLAQYYCIQNWIRKQFPDCRCYEFEATTIVENQKIFLSELGLVLNKKDLIVFQSGYTTQDLGGCHDEMHRIVIDTFPEAKILMMPQTIFFREAANRERTAKSYDRAENLLFLARDRVSYCQATEMFPHVTVKLCPDIVTMLIGYRRFTLPRRGVLFCCRNDGEKYYGDAELQVLMDRVDKLSPIERTDTNIRVPYWKIRKHLGRYIENEIWKFAHYRLIITDRYHGTIFSLIANTPVIVLKTNDHKVVTGVEWFDGLYNDYVVLADSLEDAYEKAKQVLGKEYSYRLTPYLDAEYGTKMRNAMSLAFHESGEGFIDKKAL